MNPDLLAAVPLGLVALGWWATWASSKKQAASTPYKLGPQDGGPVSGTQAWVVVPARDEAEVIEACVRAVLAQDDALTGVVVVNDGSSDGTGPSLDALARSHPRLELIHTPPEAPLPDGWLGKPWACQRGAERALERGADHLLFIDADVTLAPGALKAALGYRETHDLGLLSVMGSLELRSFWERAVQPAVVGLILAGNDLDKVNDPERRPPRPLANGQFLLFTAQAWRDIGGHHAVKQAIIDDVGLATAHCERGGGYHLLFGPRLFSCRMYAGLGAIWRGWSKNLFAGMDASWTLVGGLVLFVLLAVEWPWLALFSVGLGWTWTPLAAAWAILGMLATRVHLDRRFDQDPRYALTVPLGWAVLAAMAVNSGLWYHRGTGAWKGRALPASSR